MKEQLVLVSFYCRLGLFSKYNDFGIQVMSILVKLVRLCNCLFSNLTDLLQNSASFRFLVVDKMRTFVQRIRQMNNTQTLNYQRIAKAIEFINENFKSQPPLDEIAEHVHLSPFHFQKLFTDWAGVSPKKFLQYTTLNYAKSMLRHPQTTLFDVVDQTGLSGTSRLHDLFVKIEGMTPAEYKNGGENLRINYSFYGSPFGDLLVGSTTKGICYLMFVEDKTEALNDLRSRFQKAEFIEEKDDFQTHGVKLFTSDWTSSEQVKLHLKGTEFQLKVWESLLRIPLGKLSTYGAIAEELQNPKASRAVGTAIGNNPVAFLIPCHRVIQTSGKLGGYMWGTTRKQAIIGWEAAKETTLI